VTKKYQMTEFDTSALAVPEQVAVAMDEIAADLREGLLALAVGAGLQVMQQLMEVDVAAACGPRGRHDPDRTATRHGSERGSVALGGRRVPVSRPRVRAVDVAGRIGGLDSLTRAWPSATGWQVHPCASAGPGSRRAGSIGSCPRTSV
jgi:hypothetical protein